MANDGKTTTIRLTAEDEKILARLGKKMGLKASQIIKYAIRRLDEEQHKQ